MANIRRRIHSRLRHRQKKAVRFTGAFGASDHMMPFTLRGPKVRLIRVDEARDFKGLRLTHSDGQRLETLFFNTCLEIGSRWTPITTCLTYPG